MSFWAVDCGGMSGKNLQSVKACWQIEQQAICSTSFISHACFSLVNTFKSICHPLSHSSHGDLHLVSHLYFYMPSPSVSTAALRH